MLDTPPLQGDVIERGRNLFAVPWIRWLSAVFKVLQANQYDNITQYEVPTASGFSVSANDDTGLVYLNISSAFAAGSVAFPTSLVNQRVFRIASTKNILALTLSASKPIYNAPSTITGGSAIEFIYLSTPDAWFRLG